MRTESKQEHVEKDRMMTEGTSSILVCANGVKIRARQRRLHEECRHKKKAGLREDGPGKGKTERNARWMHTDQEIES